MDEKFDVQMHFSILKNGEKFVDMPLTFYNVDRVRMLLLENEIVDLLIRLNQLEQPQAAT